LAARHSFWPQHSTTAAALDATPYPESSGFVAAGECLELLLADLDGFVAVGECLEPLLADLDDASLYLSFSFF
jgi:hypothetical protein